MSDLRFYFANAISVGVFGRGWFWIRIFGVGFVAKNIPYAGLLFSERRGLYGVRIGPLYFAGLSGFARSDYKSWRLCRSAG